MANRNVKSLELFYTTALQTINTLSETGSDYAKFKSEPFDIPVPEADFVSDAGMVGDGVGYSQNELLYTWKPQSLPIKGRLNDYIFPVLFKRVLGGTVVNAAVTSTSSYDHTVPMATELELVEPQLTGFITKGQAGFIWADMYVKSLTILQNRDEQPRYEAMLENTGFHKNLLDSSISLTGVAAVNSNYLGASYNGRLTSFVYNDGSSQDLTALKGLISVQANLTQPCEVIGLPGDGLLTSGDATSGGYAGTVMRQTQDQNIITMRVYTNSSLGQWAKMKAGTTLTNVILKFAGKIIGATTDKYETEVKLTKAQFIAVKGATEGEYEALDITIKAIPDATTKRLSIGRIRNANATLV